MATLILIIAWPPPALGRRGLPVPVPALPQVRRHRPKIRKLNRAHFALCNRCAGTGRVQRLGSRLIHRAALTARTELARRPRRPPRPQGRRTRRRHPSRPASAPAPRYWPPPQTRETSP